MTKLELFEKCREAFDSDLDEEDRLTLLIEQFDKNRALYSQINTNRFDAFGIELLEDIDEPGFVESLLEFKPDEQLLFGWIVNHYWLQKCFNLKYYEIAY